MNLIYNVYYITYTYISNTVKEKTGHSKTVIYIQAIYISSAVGMNLPIMRKQNKLSLVLYWPDK